MSVKLFSISSSVIEGILEIKCRAEEKKILGYLYPNDQTLKKIKKQTTDGKENGLKKQNIALLDKYNTLFYKLYHFFETGTFINNLMIAIFFQIVIYISNYKVIVSQLSSVNMHKAFTFSFWTKYFSFPNLY